MLAIVAKLAFWFHSILTFKILSQNIRAVLSIYLMVFDFILHKWFILFEFFPYWLALPSIYFHCINLTVL